MANQVQSKGIMLFYDACGRWIKKLTNEQLGYVLKAATEVWEGNVQLEDAIQTAQAEMDMLVSFAVKDFATSALRAQDAYRRNVARGGIGGIKGKLIGEGMTEEQFDTEVNRLREQGLDEPAITEVLKGKYREMKAVNASRKTLQDKWPGDAHQQQQGIALQLQRMNR